MPQRHIPILSCLVVSYFTCSGYRNVLRAVWSRNKQTERKLSYVNRPRRSSGCRACEWTQGSQAQTRPRMMGFLTAIKIRNTTSFGGEEKPLVPCLKMLRHVKYPYSKKRDASRQNPQQCSPIFSFLCY
jgi:hypothetical protein